MSNLIQGILAGLALIIVGLYVISIPYPTLSYFFPAVGAVLIGGGVLTVIAILRS